MEKMHSVEALMNAVLTNRNNQFHYMPYRVRATISDIKSNLPDVIYQGCPDDLCQKKVFPWEDGTFFCPQCERSYKKFEPRYKLKVKLEDDSAAMWVTMFDTAMWFLGITRADELVRMHEKGLRREYELILHSPLNKTFLFEIEAMNMLLDQDVEWVNGIVVSFG